MDKRERLEKTLAGQQPDRRAVSLWRHWPGDDQRAADLAKSTIWFQQQFDWDFSVVAPANNFSVVDYGLQDAWQGSSYGLRDITKRVVQRSLDWTHLRTLDPMRGDLAKQVDCLRLVGEAFEADRVPFIQPVYSPFAQALRLAGRERLVSHLRQEPARLQTGLNILTESTLRFVEALRRTQVAGILYIVEGASHNVLSEHEYATFGLPYDRKILEAVSPDWWFNLVHVSGYAPMLKLVTQYPVQAISWENGETTYTLDDVRSFYKGVLWAGLGGTSQPLHDDTPTTVRSILRQSLREADHRFILGTGGTIPITAPLSNLQTVRQVVNR